MLPSLAQPIGTGDGEEKQETKNKWPHCAETFYKQSLQPIKWIVSFPSGNGCTWKTTFLILANTANTRKLLLFFLFVLFFNNNNFRWASLYYNKKSRNIGLSKAGPTKTSSSVRCCMPKRKLLRGVSHLSKIFVKLALNTLQFKQTAAISNIFILVLPMC